MENHARIPGFYRLSIAERRDLLGSRDALTAADRDILDSGGLDLDAADHLIENVIGLYALPLGLALNFRIGGRDRLVPMVVEEPSVVAAASNAARLVRAAGGFSAEVDAPILTAQVQLVDVADADG